MKFTKSQIYSLLDDSVDVQTDKWRHGTRETHVVPYEGKFYRFTVDFDTNEGLQIWGDVDAEEVYAKEETKTVYTTDFQCAPAPYDSAEDTRKHIGRVSDLISTIRVNLYERALNHDKSKLGPNEKPFFDKLTPKLKEMTYGSPEYRTSLRELGPALEHHYKNNSHHPEFYPNGIKDMSLMDILEMLADWKAAGERHNNGSVAESLKKNKERFGISDELYKIIETTVKELEWI